MSQNSLMQSLRVLVVEDDDDSREMLTELIGSLGCDSLGAANADEATERARDGAWDIALIDLGLPDVDGCEVARRLRAAEVGRRRKLVALTGFSDTATRMAAREAGFDDFLVKPVFPEKLLEVLKAEAAPKS
jgi:CheY-like chemotaxis protein